MSSILRINSITSRSGINTLDFTGNGFSYVTDVGFGTTSPRGKLDVQGTFLANGGNAGIGTTLPTSRLDVVGDVQVSGVVTATSFRGDGSNLTGVAATSNIRTNAIVNSGVTTVSAGTAAIPSISPDGDPNTGIFFPAADTTAFTQNGVEAVRIDSSGRVAIGTNTSLSAEFEVFGGTTSTIQIKGGGGGSNTARRATLALLASGNKLYNLRADAFDGSFQILDSSTERLRIDSSGNLGIGTTNPSAIVGTGKILNITNTGHATISIQAVDSTNDRNSVLEILSSGNGGSESKIVYGDTDTTPGTSSPLVFYGRHSGTTTERLKIDSSGNVTPGANATQNLGSSSLRWANIFSADLQLSNEGSQNDIDGTWGNYTIQEGENDLFLINRRNGKKYKFVLQEVN